MIFFGFFVVFLMGIFLMLLFKKNFSFWEKIIFGSALGIAMLPLIMYFLGLLKIPLTLFNVLGVILLLNLLFLFLLNKSYKGLANIWKNQKLKFEKLNFPEIILLSILVCLVVAGIVINLYWPVYEWDALSLYDFRGLRFFETHSLAQSVLTSQITGYNHTYSFFTSLIHTYVYLLGGKNAEFVYSIFYFFLIAVFYLILRRKISRPWSLFFTVCLATDLMFYLNSLMAYINVAYVLYFILATSLLWEFLANEKRIDALVMSSVFLGISAFVRTTEPFWIINILLMTYLCIRRKQFGWLILSLLIFAVIRESWALFRQYMIAHFMNEENFVLHYTVDFKKLFLSLKYLFQQVFVGRKYLLFILLITAINNIYKKRSNWFILLSFLGYFALVYVGVYLFSVSFVWWADIPDSARRTTMILIPLMIYYVSLTFSKANK